MEYDRLQYIGKIDLRFVTNTMQYAIQQTYFL